MKSKKKTIWQSVVLLLLIAGTVVTVSLQRSKPYQKDTGFVFGTVYNITYQHGENIKADIEAELQKVDNSLSPFNKQSIISKINRNENIDADEMFIHVFKLAQEISVETGGAFDVTIAPVMDAWGFGTS